MHCLDPKLLCLKLLWQAEANLLILTMQKKHPIHLLLCTSLTVSICCGSMQRALMTGLTAETMVLHSLATTEHLLSIVAAGKLFPKKRMAKTRWKPYLASKEKMMGLHCIQKILLR